MLPALHEFGIDITKSILFVVAHLWLPSSGRVQGTTSTENHYLAVSSIG